MGATIAVILMLGFAHKIGATPPNPPWCHCAESGVCNTLFLPQQALEQAGHVSAQGNPLHAGDHAGACVEVTPTITPSVTPTEEPTATPTPENKGGPGDGQTGSLGPDGLGCATHSCDTNGQVLHPATAWK